MASSITTTAALVVFMLFLASFSGVESKYIAYNTSQSIVDGKLNVHLVAHTHDDVGWLKTVDQYYVGSNNSIQIACVQNVLDSMVPALLADKNRKFIYVEQAFFQRWWNEQSETIQDIVKKLVRSGQLELINGGMCMHDEAAPHYIDMIDQTTLGHRFIKQVFNQTPRIGWQIDPFGHSAVQAYLLGAEVGFDSFFFGRIDYQDLQKRKNEKRLEFIWQGSKTLGSSAQIFAGALSGNYEPPSGDFYFEVSDASPVVQDDPDLFDYNVQERVDDFVANAISQANITRTNHIMWTMGTDFKYQYANSWFRQMDKFIHYVNMDGRVNALYSTPSIYTDAKWASRESWPLKTGDFFPYADRANSYWTGYFTSRPALKRYVRVLSGYYLAARQLEFFKGRNKSRPNTDSLADALAIAQHHDAISGTSKQHVANDYAKRLSMGYAEAEELVASSLASLTESTGNRSSGKPATKFEQCPLLNISYCPPTEVDLSHGKSFVIVVHNALGWKREDVVRIPVTSESVTVRDSSGREIESQLLPLSSASLNIRNYHIKAYLGKFPSDTPKYWLAFSASVPPLGFSTYTVSGTKTGGAGLSKSKSIGHGTLEVGQGNLKLTYDVHQGKFTQYINRRSLVKAPLQQSYSYYTGYDHSDQDPQASGAYVFRPNGTFVLRSGSKVPATVLQGPVLDEVHQQVNEWIHQITRVYKGKEHAEVEFIVGPIPIEDKISKEITTKISTTLKTNKTFYTDSNGRDFIKRVRDYRPDWELQVNQHIAGNYYPINLGIYIEDDKTELSVLVDRSVGGSSLMDGQVELMLHRRLVHDDSRGVAEALNETVCVSDKCTGLIIQGNFYLRIDPVGEGAKWRRSFGQEIYSPFLLAFTEQDGDNWRSSHVTSFSGMDPSYSLPDNVAMLTLQELADGKVLVRMAHLYEMGEDKDLSRMAHVELRKLFPYKKISEVTEMSLSANQERAEMERKRLVWKSEGSSSEVKAKVVKGGALDPVKLVVELGPMEIRTFTIDFGGH
ncbi:probable alpha-mannosidase At5g13980 [Papaver somniferum]|uniref:probable alpha-mannosidase At5g13980 n=1 Tax=Papaver somniferum TaxID=3469 RepID=UPI000E7006E0|nr:probable alpha-mannosidase At5g13980 [Papaver somniferum]